MYCNCKAYQFRSFLFTFIICVFVAKRILQIVENGLVISV